MIGGGNLLTIIIGGVQITRARFIFKNTLGEAFDKKKKLDENDDDTSPLQGMIAGLSATVGTGNIVGVDVAIGVGGPRALFWIWVTGFLLSNKQYGNPLNKIILSKGFLTNSTVI
ncbi:MAG: sodium:alanine symporter family protein [Tissierella sp.]|nr:sodium:alanine symporter family protein [Tissierella sp.]